MTATVLDAIRARVTGLVELAAGGYRWEPESGRYRDLSTGRYVSEQAIARDIDRYNDTIVKERIRATTQQMLDGKLALQDWQTRMARELKDAYVVNVQIGRGGRNATQFSDYGRIGGRLQFEYRKLDEFAQQIKAGEAGSAAQVMARANQYAGGPRTAYFDGQQAAKEEAGLTEERRVLNPAEHCDDCVGYAAEGWKPIGWFPPPGTGSACGHNCRCTMEYK